MTGNTTGIVGVYTKRDPEFLLPGSPEWSKIITPSKVAAILGVSRYESAYRLWHRMTGRCEPEPPKDAFVLGHAFEPAAANLWREDNPGWKLSPGEVQVHVDPDKFGFPCVATIDARAVSGRSRRVAEFKIARNLNDLEQWGDDLKGECPQDYAAQVQAQMLFTGWTKVPGHLLVIGPSFDHRIYEIPYSPNQAAWIIDEARQFWELLKADEPPDLDDSVHTYQCLRALNPDIEQGQTVVLDGAAAVEYVTARVDFEDAEAAYQGAKNRLVREMGRAQYAEFGNVRIASRRNTGKGSVALYAAKGVDPQQVRFLQGEPTA